MQAFAGISIYRKLRNTAEETLIMMVKGIMRIILLMMLIMISITVVWITSECAEIYMELQVAYKTLSPLGIPQQIIAVNDMFPGPQINATAEDILHLNVFNNLDESLLMTWDGVQLRRASWQDGVMGTNCPILVGANWTYQFQIKDQIGSFFYFPTMNFQKAAGGYGSIRVNNPWEIPTPFPPPDHDIVLLIGDWYTSSHKDLREMLNKGKPLGKPDGILINGKGPYNNSKGAPFETLTVQKGLVYRIRVSNVGVGMSLSLHIESHRMRVVETEGSYVESMHVDTLDVHVGQSYSFLLHADQPLADYYIVARPRVANNISDYSSVTPAVAILHYSNSSSPVKGSLPKDPHHYDTSFSLNQARSLRWNTSASASRKNPQGSFQQGKIPINKTYIFESSQNLINDHIRFGVNGISYSTPDTPLKLADYYNLTDVFDLDSLPQNPPSQSNVTSDTMLHTSVIVGPYRGFVEYVFINTEREIQSWHTDGYSFFVVGMGANPWTNKSRNRYNRRNAVSRCTIQVYPGMWSAVLLELDNVGMWNIRSEHLERWYLGQELYMRVHNPEDNLHRTELPMPSNALYCGRLGTQKSPSDQGSTPTTPGNDHPSSNASTTSNAGRRSSYFHKYNNIIVALTLCIFLVISL